MLFLATVMFPRELKIQAFLIIHRHSERWFGRVPTMWLRWLWSTHLCFCRCTLNRFFSEPSCRLHRWFIHKRLSFNYSQIRSHRCPGGAAALQWQWAIRSETHIKSQAALGSPRLSIHVNRISILSAHTKEISAQMVCQYRPNKPVYVLNTVGTLDVPRRHRHRQVITAITPSY